MTALLFGLLTVVSGGNTLFGSEAAQRAAGADGNAEQVPRGAQCLALGALWWCRPWAVVPALAVTLTTLITCAAFGVHVLQGGADEGRTVAVISLRSAAWLAIWWLTSVRVWRASPAGCRTWVGGDTQ